jgi:hypothetical protein
MTSDTLERSYTTTTHDGWEERRGPIARRSTPRSTSEAPPVGLLVGGLVIVGLGALALYYLGPDLVRYMKIKRM